MKNVKSLAISAVAVGVIYFLDGVAGLELGEYAVMATGFAAVCVNFLKQKVGL